MNSPDPIPLGKYRGFETELLFNTAERNYEVRLKGATSRNVPLGDDAHGNIIRLDNGIERFAESLSLAENDLENTKISWKPQRKKSKTVYWGGRTQNKACPTRRAEYSAQYG